MKYLWYSFVLFILFLILIPAIIIYNDFYLANCWVSLEEAQSKSVYFAQRDFNKLISIDELRLINQNGTCHYEFFVEKNISIVVYMDSSNWRIEWGAWYKNSL